MNLFSFEDYSLTKFIQKIFIVCFQTDLDLDLECDISSKFTQSRIHNVILKRR